MGCQQLFTIAKQFQQDAIEQIENFGKMLNRTKYRYERRGYYTFAPQRAKRLADGCSFTICQPLFCQLYCQSGGQGVASGNPLLRKGIIAASGYLAQMWAQAPVCICLLWQAWHNTLDFAEQSRVPRNPCAVSLDSSGYDSAGLFSPALSFVVPPAR